MVLHKILGRSPGNPTVLGPARSSKNRQLVVSAQNYLQYLFRRYLHLGYLSIWIENIHLFMNNESCITFQSIVILCDCSCSRADCKLTPFICCNFANLLSETGIMNTSEHFCGDFLAFNQTFMALNVMLDEYMINFSYFVEECFWYLTPP